MFPLVTLLVPIFETMRTLGLLNTYTALVLPYIGAATCRCARWCW